MDLSLISESDWTKNLPKKGEKQGKKLKETKIVQEQKLCPRQRRQKMLSADCTPAAETFRKLSPHLRKWERCDLGGKHRARCYHLLLAPLFRLTPNEAKGGSP